MAYLKKQMLDIKHDLADLRKETKMVHMDDMLDFRHTKSLRGDSEMRQSPSGTYLTML